MASPRSLVTALIVFLQFQNTVSASDGPVRRQDSSTYLPGSTLELPSVTSIESVSLLTTVSTSFTVSNGQEESTVIPITVTETFTSPSLPVSYIPSNTPVSYTPSNTPAPTPKSSLPILPIAAAAGGLVFIIALVLPYLFLRRRRRIAAARRDATAAESRPKLDLRLEMSPTTPSLSGGRTFSRLTFSAPYVVPQSPVEGSTAAPSTVSIGQQYHTAPTRRR
ncbi:hypothetical protein C8R44DRAFT_757244 [Mycena epipterygia]|nr:hypothetical protein C8R44DRAFT_757244 [Mycena epipterygia]